MGEMSQTSQTIPNTTAWQWQVSEEPQQQKPHRERERDWDSSLIVNWIGGLMEFKWRWKACIWSGGRAGRVSFLCLFQKNGLLVQEESALSSTSFITRSATNAETGDPIVLLVFTCAVYSIIYVCFIYNWLSLQIEIMSCVQLNVSLLWSALITPILINSCFTNSHHHSIHVLCVYNCKNSGVSCECRWCITRETPPTPTPQYCNHVSDCRVQCTFGTGNH